MKRLLLIILLSVGFTNVSFAYEYGNAELCSLVSSNNCDGLCVSADSELVTEARKRKLSCGGVTETLQYDISSNDVICKNGFYKSLEDGSSYPYTNASFCKKLPANTLVSGSPTSMIQSYSCKPGYYNKFEFGGVCEKVPANAVKRGNGWVCKDGYKKSVGAGGNICKKEGFLASTSTSTERSFEIWTNNALCNFVSKKKANAGHLAELEIREVRCKNLNTNLYNIYDNWECSNGLTDLSNSGVIAGKDSCIEGKRIPENARVSDTALGWKCKAGYKNTSKNQCIPDYSIVSNSNPNGWECIDGYYMVSKGMNVGKSCRKQVQFIPKNAKALGFSWACNSGYKKSGNKCFMVVPSNSKATGELNFFPQSGSSFTCNNGYYKNQEKSLCLRVPANATKTSNDLTYSCNTGYKKSGNKCIPKLVIPKNAKASGSSFMCNNGYYKNSSTTGCLKVPAFAKKRSNDKGWVCNSGYTKTGTSCTNTAELKRIEEAKKIAQAKAAKVLKAAQLDARNYYNDLEAFLKTNTKEYDTRKILELRKQNKVILTQPWDAVLARNFAELKSFTATSKAFRDYHQLRNDARQRAILNELDKANTRLKNISAYLNYYVDNNFTSNITLEVLDQIDIATAGLKKQSLDGLIKVSTQLENFIANNKLANDFKAFSKAIAQSAPDEPEEVVQKIDATDLLTFDFMKKANRGDYLALINLTGKAPNALLNLEGDVVFENDRALSCFYQSKNTIKNDLKYYLYDTFSNKEFLVMDRGFECKQNNLLDYDLVFFEKGTLVKESKSYLTSLAAALAYNELQLFKIITKQQRSKDFDSRKDKAADIIEGLEEEMLVGFGAVVIDNDNTTLCTDVKNTLGQASIMRLLSNEFTRMGYGKSVSNTAFNSAEDTFANVQRDRCGFIYAGEETLANLLNAFKSSGTKYDVLPVWYSKKMVKNEQLRQEGKEQSELIEDQKAKEQKDKVKELARLRAEAEQEALKASGVLKVAEQKRLQARHRNTVEAHVQLIEKEAKLLLDKDPSNTIKEHMALVGPLLSKYPNLINYIEDQFKESWELVSFSVEINDFGLGSYRSRMIETFITEIDFKLKNNDLGEYSEKCYRVGIIDDKEFNRLREPKLAGCKPGSLDSYKKRLNFQSNWLVQ